MEFSYLNIFAWVSTNDPTLVYSVALLISTSLHENFFLFFDKKLSL